MWTEPAFVSDAQYTLSILPTLIDFYDRYMDRAMPQSKLDVLALSGIGGVFAGDGIIIGDTNHLLYTYVLVTSYVPCIL